MIGLDTNVLVRYIMQDDDIQSPMATRLLESLTVEVPGFIPLVVVVELGWVLSSAYGLERSQLSHAIQALLRAKELVIEQAETLSRALRLFERSKADFADCLIERSAIGAGCERMMTFDRGAVRECGMTLVGETARD